MPLKNLFIHFLSVWLLACVIGCGAETEEVRLPHLEEGRDLCLTVTCEAPPACRKSGVCDPTTGACTYEPLQDGQTCDDGNPCTAGERCQAGSCAGGSQVTCPALDSCHNDGECDQASGCIYPAKANGETCDDADPCTDGDACSEGVCGGTPRDCAQLDDCHEPGECSPADGECHHAPRADGADCDPTPSSGGELGLCERGSCFSGACISVPKTCPAIDQCHAAGACDPLSGICSTPPVIDGEFCDDGDPCTEHDFCDEGVCQAGSAVTCSTTAVCRIAGTCIPGIGCVDEIAPDGDACDDGSSCTRQDRCQKGNCEGSDPVVCTALDVCHNAGECNPLTGICTNPERQNGAGCDDHNVCTSGTTCTAGVCGGGTPVIVSPGQCELAGSCDSVLGWRFSKKDDGEKCDDGNPCTRTDSCQSGQCRGTDPVICSPLGECFETTGCDPATGLCRQVPRTGNDCSVASDLCMAEGRCDRGTCVGTAAVDCSHVPCLTDPACDPGTGTCFGTPVANNTDCDDGDPCTASSSCSEGICVGGAPVTCAPLDSCHAAGFCDSANGACTNPPALAGPACGEGVCFADATRAWALSWVGGGSSPIGSAGIAVLDFDRDGYTDIAIAGEGGGLTLFRNVNNTGFVDATVAAGLPRSLGADTGLSGIASADYDKDGYSDLLILTTGRNRLYRNTRLGGFMEVTTGLDEVAWSTSASFADFDHDGLLDLYVGNYIAGSSGSGYTASPNHLYRNRGGYFEEVGESFGVAGEGLTLAVAWSDVNSDRWPDLLVCNDVATGTEQGNRLYLNQGASGPVNPEDWFIDASESMGADLSIRCRGIAAADFDNDGDLDYYFAAIGSNVLLRNDGSSFVDVAEDVGAQLARDVCDVSAATVSWGGAWADFNLDGLWDLYVGNGYLEVPGMVVAEHEANALLKNTGGHFTDVAVSAGAADSRRARGGVIADLDGDGAVDIVQANSSGSALLLRNVTAAAGKSIRVKLEGVRSNREGRGARVLLTAGAEPPRLFEVGSANGFASSSSPVVIFGLGAHATADLKVEWPLGTNQEVYDVPAGSAEELMEPLAISETLTPGPDPIHAGGTATASTSLVNEEAASVSATYHLELRADGTLLASGGNQVVELSSHGTESVSASVDVPSNAVTGASRAARLVLVVEAGLGIDESKADVTLLAP